MAEYAQQPLKQSGSGTDVWSSNSPTISPSALDPSQTSSIASTKRTPTPLRQTSTLAPAPLPARGPAARVPHQLRVFHTIPLHFNSLPCLLPYANNTRFMFIVHHVDKAHSTSYWQRQLLSWTNVFVLSNQREIAELTPRHFCPA